MPRARKAISAALKKLNIDQPFDLKNESGIGLKPKKTLAYSKVNEFEVPHSEAPHSNLPHNNDAQGQGPQIENPQNEVPQSRAARNEASQSEVPQSELPDIEISQVGADQIERPRIEIPHRETTQYNVAKPEVPKVRRPQTEVAQSDRGEPPEQVVEIEGYFRLPHSVFLDERVSHLSGDGFKLYIWLCSRAWRFSDSNGRVRASISFISMCSGMTDATISRNLAALKKCGLIELWKKDFKRGNIWSVKCSAVWLDGPKAKRSRNEAPKNKRPQKRRLAASIRESGASSLGEQVPRIEGHPTSPTNKTTLTHGVPHAIQEYLDGLKPETRRIAEREKFFELQNEYRSKEISQAFNWVRSRGELGSGTPVHSPFAYLAKTMSHVLAEANEQSRQRAATEAARQKEADRLAKEEAENRKAEEEQRRAERAFAKAFPNPEEQEAVVAEIIQARFKQFTPPKNIARKVAISAWFDESSVKIGKEGA